MAGTTAEQVLLNFFNCLLYEPLRISLYPNHFKLFNVVGLDIPYDWLLPNERKYIAHVFLHRFEFFKTNQFYPNGSFVLKFMTGTLPLRYRRELARDFLWMAMAQKENGLGSGIFLRVIQKMCLRDKPDPLVLQMHEALQGRFDVRDILCL